MSHMKACVRANIFDAYRKTNIREPFGISFAVMTGACVSLVTAMAGGLDGGGGGVPNSVFNKKIVLIRDSISEISP